MKNKAFSPFNDLHQLRQFCLFCTQLQRLLKAGVSLDKSLQLILSTTPQKTQRSALKNLIQDIKAGKSFYAALGHLLPESLPYHFEGFHFLPNLPLFLGNLEDYYQTKLSTLQKTAKQLAYPLFLCLSTVLMSLFFYTTLLPIYAQFYEAQSMQIPTGLGILFAIQASPTTTPVVLTFLGMVFVAMFIKRQRVKTHLYGILFPFHTGDIAWILAMMLNNGISLKQGVSTLSKTHNGPGAFLVHALELGMAKTGNITQIFTEVFQLNALQTELLKMSEHSGTLGLSLQDLAADINATKQAQFNRRLSLLQPCLMGIMGLLILGFMLLTMMPMLSTIKSL
ncbi:MAG: type II secretion system F family protein [Candidatus Margulisiibacteriota bacterium]